MREKRSDEGRVVSWVAYDEIDFTPASSPSSR